MWDNRILISVNGQKLPVPSHYDPCTRLIDVLRSETRFKGPKVGCGEGGCGACTVIVDRLDPATGVVSRVTLNSCLATVGSLDGAAVTTSEGLGNSEKGFNPAQEALARRFGSQCGYCSPGMVVAMTAAAVAATAPGAGQPAAALIARGLDGNLCRCTGWRPIIDACRDVADLEDLHKQPCRGAPEQGPCHSSSSGSAPTCAALPPPPEDTFPSWLRQYILAKRRNKQQQQQQQSVCPSSNDSGQLWLRPCTLSEVAAAVHAAAVQGSSPKLVSGNTGAGVYKDMWPHDPLVIDLSGVNDMHTVTFEQQGVWLGAAVTLQQLIHILRSPGTAAAAEGCSHKHICPAAAAGHGHQCSSSGQQCRGDGSCSGRAGTAPSSSTQAVWSAVADHLERIAGVHVRSAATLGGHFALCARKPLPTDLGLLLAAAGAHIQIMTVRPAEGSGKGSSSNQQQWQRWQHQQQCYGVWQQQQRPQRQQYDLHWVSVEDYLEASCIGSNGCRQECSNNNALEITADSIAGGNVLYEDSQPRQSGSCAPSSSSGNGHITACGTEATPLPHVITAVWLPYGDDSSERLWSYKLAVRHVNSHALVNAALWIKFDQQPAVSTTPGSSSAGGNNSSCGCEPGQLLESQTDPRFAGVRVASARLFVGLPPGTADGTSAAASEVSSSSGRGPKYQADEPWCMSRVREVESVLCGRAVDVKVIIASLRELESHLAAHANIQPTHFSSQALQGILYKALVPLLNPETTIPKSLHPKIQRLLLLPKPYDPRVLPEGRQVLPGASEQSSGVAPVHLPVEKDAVRLQASGEAVFAADVAAGMTGQVLYLAGVKSSEALASIASIDTSATAAVAGVVGVITSADIPGQNKAFDAPLLADGRVEYVGQLIALVAATTQAAAERAAAAVCVTYSPIPGQTPIITIDQAIAAGSFHNDFPQLHAAAVAPGKLAAHGLSLPAADGSTNSNSSKLDSLPCSQVNGTHEGRSSSTKALVDLLIASSPHQITNAGYQLPAQQHMYMETQTSVAEPVEGGGVKVTSSTQSLDAVQQVVAAVLGIPFNKVTVVAKRLGGGFGGKASRSMPVAAAAALAAAHFTRPVCYSLSRNDDLLMNHGRCLGQVTYDVGFDDSGKVHAIKAQVVYRAGAYLDLGGNDGATLVTASDSAYDLSGLAVDVKYARCNIPPHTIVRAPGFLQGVMLLEQVMEHVAAVLGMDSAAVKAANFLSDLTSSSSSNHCSKAAIGSSCAISSNMGRLCIGSPAAYLQQHKQHTPGNAALLNKLGAEQLTQQHKLQHQAGVTTVLGRFISSDTYTLPLLWQQLLSSSQYSARLSAVQQYNRDHAWSKRGIVVTPVRFDCAPAAVSAAVSVYADGSVLITHGGIEMGQGLTTKVEQAAVAALSQLLPDNQRPLPLSLVRVAASSSDVVPNGGPTWSSTGSEGNCQAVMNAAAKVVKQLMPHVQVQEDGVMTWKATIASLYSDAVGFTPAGALLSAYGYFDGTTGSGDAKQAVQYSAFGAAVSEVEIDVLTGERRVLSSHIKYDCGYPLNPAIDLGQIEGGFVMGLGAMLSEDVVIDPATGQTLSASTWKYKIPTMDLIPQQFTVEFGDLPNPRGILSSKASGEPAVMASTSALMAMQQAAAAAAQEVQGLLCGASRNVTDHVGFQMLSAPATPEKLKGVVGGFSLADVLEAATGAPAV